MRVLAWIIWGVGCVLLTTQMFLVFHRDGGVARLAKRFCILLATGLVITILFDVSKFHLLWWMPLVYAANIYLFHLSAGRQLASYMESIEPEIGRSIQWSGVVRQVFRVLDFDRSGAVVGDDGTITAKSVTRPYGYLLVESPTLNRPIRLPITHRDDFGLAASVFDQPQWEAVVKGDGELLVTYIPKHNLPGGLSGVTHGLHYVIAPRGTLDKYYVADNGHHMANPAPEKLFGEFVWEGELRVQINAEPQI